MVYKLFHITQFIFQLIYSSASQLQVFFMTEFDYIIAQVVGSDLQIFGDGVTVLEALFSVTLTLVFALIMFNFLKKFFPG